MNILHPMKDFLNKPYDLLESKAFRYLFVFGGSAFALIFLWIFEPYGLYNLTKINEKILAIGLYVGVGLVAMFLQFFPAQRLLIKNHTVLNSILWIMLSFVIIGTSSSIINSYLYNDGHFNFIAFIYFQGIILSINIIPVSVFVLVHYNLTLRKRLKIATNVNNALNTKNDKLQDREKEVIFNSENKKEGMTLTLDSLIFISSMDNYIAVNYLENGIVDKKLLRYSLSRVEIDNKNIFELFRCHKGYIVNKRKIESISGNAAGYKIKLTDYNGLIPVSRKWNKEIETIALV